MFESLKNYKRAAMIVRVKTLSKTPNQPGLVHGAPKGVRWGGLLPFILALPLTVVSGCDSGSDKKKDKDEDTSSESDTNSEDQESNSKDKNKDDKSTSDEDGNSESKSKNEDSDEDSNEDGSPLPEVPAPYKGEKNPNAADDKGAQDAGKIIYLKKSCVECHGKDGEGSIIGIAHLGKVEREDDFWLWRISEGAGEFMAPYKEDLSREEIWQVVSYLRTFAK